MRTDKILKFAAVLFPRVGQIMESESENINKIKLKKTLHDGQMIKISI